MNAVPMECCCGEDPAALFSEAAQSSCFNGPFQMHQGEIAGWNMASAIMATQPFSFRSSHRCTEPGRLPHQRPHEREQAITIDALRSGRLTKVGATVCERGTGLTGITHTNGRSV
jgi:hypothetical protein